MASSESILVVGELAQGKPSTVTRELLAAARKLAQGMGASVSVVFCAEKAGQDVGEAIAAGANRVYTVEHALLTDGHPEAHLAALEKVVKQLTPTVVLLGRTPLGRDVAPRLAFRLDVGLAQDCMALEWDAAQAGLVAHRPVYGGVSTAKVLLRTRPCLVTVRPKVFEPLSLDSPPQGEVASLKIDLDTSVCVTTLVERVHEHAAGVRLEDARVVVGVGRGIGGPGPVKQAEELAGLLRGAVGASRAVCDAGWLPFPYQVGLTGKTITADLYIAIAISGASQHMAGVATVKNIVAINKDSEANIFKEARYGVVGDWTKVLPSFIETVRELVKS
jgi:electron transfer flavoprotein alpha subunit